MKNCPLIISLLILLILTISINCKSVNKSNDTNNNGSDSTDVENRLQIIAESSRLWTGVAVSDDKRIFVNYPHWSRNFTVSVAEVNESGQKIPYPDEEWNNWNIGDAHEGKFICVQSVYYYDGFLWVLDSGNPLLGGVLEGAAKIVKIDLSTNTVSEIIYVDDNVLESNSYLNDLRIYNNYIIITDSGSSGIIVIDMSTGQMIRRLAEHYSTMADMDYQLYVEDRLVNLEVHSDGLAIDQDNSYVYYKALSSANLYKINVDLLINNDKTDSEISDGVVHVGEFGAADGLFFFDGKLYITAIEENSIKIYDPLIDECADLIKANNLKWPDSVSITSDGILYVTTSQLHLPATERGYYRLFNYNLE